MKHSFSEIVIIYNPNSTGESKKNSQALRESLRAKLPAEVVVSLQATSHAGHAIEIGRRYAKKDNKVLLISSSGDGGYNELVNGVLRHDTKYLTVMVLPSGNANDHHHATKNEDIVSRIVAGKTTNIDVLQVDATVRGKPLVRYAHSYAGIGLTAYVGKKLAEAELNSINEKWLTLKYLLAFKYVTVQLESQKRSHRYSSIVFGNIDRMSKIIKLSKRASLTDGRFEVYETRQRSSLRIIAMVLLASTIGLKAAAHIKQVQLKTSEPLQLQCDGEVFTVDGDSTVIITSRKRHLRVIK